MCGIVAIYAQQRDPAGASPDVAALMPDLLSTLANRGPDERHHVQLGPVWLGHTRLSIIDLDTGSQPVFNEDGTIAVILNGEIYNHRELRAGLECRGHVFRTRSDTEVIVHLYEEYGENLFDHLIGMFALVIYDRPADVLLAGRDRMGQKPLLYREVDGHLLLASELKTLLRWPGSRHEIDREALALYINAMCVPAPLSIVRGVRKLQPAHSLRWSAGRLTTRRYWRPDLAVDERLTEQAVEEEFRRLFADAVGRRLEADVPLGVFLSGGIDSSAVTAFAADISPDPVRTFAIGLSDELDERPFARLVAERCGTVHTELHARGDVSDAFPLVMDYFDEPFADSSAVPTYLVAREARAHVKTVLTGDGGDELFAGYAAYVDQKHQKGTRLASRLHAVRRRVLGRPRGAALGRGDWPLRHWRWTRSMVPPHDVPVWLGDPTLDVHGFYDRHRWLPLPADDALTVAFDHDLNYYLPDDLLKKVDMASMLTSLECRSPFLDHRLVEFCCRIPPRLKLRHDSPKHLLKRSLAGRLPQDVLHRRKHGFGAPIARWVRGPLREPARDLLRPGCRSEDWLEPAVVRSVTERMWRGADDADWRLPHQFWTVFVLEWWLRRFGQAPRARDRGVGSLLENLKADIGRMRSYGERSSVLRLYLTHQGLWACTCYRAGHWLATHRLWPGVRHLAKLVYHFWWKSTEITTGISISPDCRIGPGLYIGHFGGIILHTDVVMGAHCNLSQGVTLGLACVDGRWGVPTVGDRVCIAPGAKVIGPIHLADGTVVGANAVVTRSTPENATVVGIPARVINTNGSAEFMGT